jgi:hypothetical protein
VIKEGGAKHRGLFFAVFQGKKKAKTASQTVVSI